MKCPRCFNEMAEAGKAGEQTNFKCKEHGEFACGDGEMWLSQEKDGIRHLYYFNEKDQFINYEKYNVETKQRIL